MLADEIHTPDSSRYWIAASYPERFARGEPPESFDKDVVRSWVAARCNPYRDPVPPIPPEIVLHTARSTSAPARRSPASPSSCRRRGRRWSASAATCGMGAPVRAASAAERRPRGGSAPWR